MCIRHLGLLSAASQSGSKEIFLSINTGVENISLVKTSLNFVKDLIGEIECFPELWQEIELAYTRKIGDAGVVLG